MTEEIEQPEVEAEAEESENEDEPDVKPTPEPSREPFDPHMEPLDNEDDARFLDPTDPRRLEIERERGRPFGEDED